MRILPIPTVSLGLVLLVFPSLYGQDIEFERIQLSDEFYSEGGTFGDYDSDGHGDVAVGPWVYWGPDFESTSRIYAGDAHSPLGYSENFLMYTDDVDGDEELDILVLGFPGRESFWYQNPGTEARDKLWEKHKILDSVDNESPLIADIDGDGIRDLVCSTGGHYGFASRAGQEPTEPWTFTRISPNNGYQRFTHGLGIGDVNNDGKTDLMEKDGWWENPGKPLDEGQYWAFHPFSFSSGGAQMFAVDLDGDGKNEVVTGLVAHGFGLVYYKAINPQATEFERVDIMTDHASTSPTYVAVSQLHGMDLADFNRDGVLDIVTGKRWWAHANKDAGNSQPATLLWFETQRFGPRIRFVPHIMDISSGVGTQVTAGDVNGDGLMDVVCGIKRGAYLFLQRPNDLGEGEFLVPGLAAQDPFGQRPALASVPIKASKGSFVPAFDGRPLNLGFESGDLTDWEMRGPIAENPLVLADAKIADSGDFLLTTAQPGQRIIGEAISRPFTATHAQAICLLGGDKHDEVRVEIVACQTGQVIASASPSGAAGLSPCEFDLGKSVGQLVRIRLVDHAEDAALQFDAFRFIAD